MSRAPRYPAALAARARELHAAGWSQREVRRILEREGVDPLPALNTVQKWCSPRVAEGHRLRNRESAARARARAGYSMRYPGSRSADWKLARARALLEAGLTLEQVGRVMGVDFPDDPPLLRDSLSRALASGDPPRAWR